MWGKRLLRGLTFLGTAAVMYAALLCHPDPLFAYSVRAGDDRLALPRATAGRAEQIVRAADARVARSPLYRASDAHHVYLCDTPARFALFSLYRCRAGGVAYGGLTSNVFLRPSSLERDRLIRPNGSDVPGERTLTYFIAHEVTHAMLHAHLGRLR